MLNFVIIILIFLGLIVHRYLTTFWEQERLPYPRVFLFYACSFSLIYLVSFIWMFGIIAGFILALLCFLQLMYGSVLWIFNLPVVINRLKNFDNDGVFLEVDFFVYGGFSFLVIIVAILTAINFFVSSYKSMWKLMENDIWTLILIFVGIVVVGNIARVAIMSWLVKSNLRDK